MVLPVVERPERVAKAEKETQDEHEDWRATEESVSLNREVLVRAEKAAREVVEVGPAEVVVHGLDKQASCHLIWMLLLLPGVGRQRL